jgi:hypothetical protein
MAPIVAGAGKSVLWYVSLFDVSVLGAYRAVQLLDY